MRREAAKVKRFIAGLIIPLYNVLLATEFLTLSRLVDMQVKVYMTNVIKTFKLD